MRPPVLQRPEGSAVDETTTARTHVVADGFEETTLSAFDRPRALSSVDEPMATPSERPSGLRNMVRVLEQTQGRLAEEHRALRDEAQEVLRGLAEAGFTPEALASARESLDGLRARMAKQRRRLSDVRRRLRSAHLEAGAAGELPLQGRIQGLLDDVEHRPAGLDKRFAALTLAGQATPRNVDGTRPLALRLPVKQAGDKRDLGDALARVAPNASVSQHLATLLGWPGAQTSEPARDSLSGPLADVTSFSRVMTSSAS